MRVKSSSDKGVGFAGSPPLERDEMLHRLVDIQYTRNDYEPQPGTFRVRGDTIDIFPAEREKNWVPVIVDEKMDGATKRNQ
jgi:excinuclease UvrABC helicase subunit UvrB